MRTTTFIPLKSKHTCLNSEQTMSNFIQEILLQISKIADISTSFNI